MTSPISLVSHRNVDGSTRSIIFRQFVDPARSSPPCKSLQRPSNLTTQSRLRM